MPGLSLWFPAIPLMQSNHLRIEEYAGPAWRFCPDPPFGRSAPESAAWIRNDKSVVATPAAFDAESAPSNSRPLTLRRARAAVANFAAAKLQPTRRRCDIVSPNDIPGRNDGAGTSSGSGKPAVPRGAAVCSERSRVRATRLPSRAKAAAPPQAGAGASHRIRCTAPLRVL